VRPYSKGQKNHQSADLIGEVGRNMYAPEQ
jgi:hypothetical protein